ncbi:hypothetical protein G3T14_17075 [Methylobacterium sp. BTF04]|uniref:hypothetical protein n=1 Tax=Methylobacterium sp. BTF04 TaxID=2708300 RepID=UPI0013D0B1CF|nr:hypothetical protein [Methylobacterium sp. BTF04]NEU13826.1 hypothetical protein [Methylobacterium sp. BTF04]
MRLVLVSALLIIANSQLRADDLADFPGLACKQASSQLEREQLDCPKPTTLSSAQTKDDLESSKEQDRKSKN